MKMKNVLSTACLPTSTKLGRTTPGHPYTGAKNGMLLGLDKPSEVNHEKKYHKSFGFVFYVWSLFESLSRTITRTRKLISIDIVLFPGGRT